MKNLYLLLFCFISLHLNAQNAINNGGFENWTNDTLYLSPQDWVTTNETQFYGQSTFERSTDAIHGNFSAEFRAIQLGVDTLSGNAVLGDPQTYDGVPYSANFEAITFSYKGNLLPGDTLFLVFIRRNGGALIDYQIIPAAYGSIGTWTPNLLYVGNMLQDEVFLAFMLQNPWTGANASPSSWVRIDNIQTIAGGSPQATLPNYSFELWDAATYEEADDWYSLNWFLENFGLANANKTTDAYAGNYAIEMNTFFANPDTIASIISMAPIDLFGPIPFSNAPFNASPNLFSGAYKFNAVNGDEAGISMVFYDNGNPIGQETIILSDQATWTTFSQPVTLTGTPDSITFIAVSGNNPGSVLFLDEISLISSGAGIFEQSFADISVYPNPASSEIFVALPDSKTCTIEIISSTGQIVYSLIDAKNLNRIEVNHLQSGIYTVIVSNDELKKSQKIVIQK